MKLVRKLFEVDDKELKDSVRYSEGLRSDMAVLTKLRDPGCLIVMEEFVPGTKTARMGFWFSEIHIIIKGKAEVEYATSTPNVGVWEKNKFIPEAGDAYFMDRGDQVSFNVLSNEPYRHLCIIMPAPPYVAPASAGNKP